MLCPILFCGGFLTAVAGHVLAARRAASHAIAPLTLTGHLHLMVSLQHLSLSLLPQNLFIIIWRSWLFTDRALVWSWGGHDIFQTDCLHNPEVGTAVYGRCRCGWGKITAQNTKWNPVGRIGEMFKIHSKALWVKYEKCTNLCHTTYVRQATYARHATYAT